ncbi:DnaB-like helicase C-terminal domain-containing protein [Bacillus sp. COPE52]|uniref:replicative DNA helicase n=1 Tax=Bacillus sp. COPE52 TaxID=2233998 RepID=UPI000E10136C|nr:DnaB-like helicase C-terminal domain-containing protein [Bacillus sp. COPE52]AXK19146.1 hypothetical protein DPQ31_16180 [Bacillus sp. COPE52]
MNNTNGLKKYENHSEMEISILEAMLDDNTLIDECRLSSKHFLDSKNKELYKTIIHLNDKEMDINPQTIVGHSDLNIQDVMKVMTYGSLTTNFEFYQRRMFDFIEVEEMRKAASEFLKETEDRNSSDSSERLLNSVLKTTEEKIVKQEDFKDKLANRVQRHMDMKIDGLSGIDTGWEGLNQFTDGWQKGDLIIIGGRPGMGKTAISLDSIRKGAERNINGKYLGKFFSCEMPEGQCIDRWIAGQSMLPVSCMKNPNKFLPMYERSEKLQAGTGYAKYQMAVGELSGMPLQISEEKDLRLMKAEMRKTVKENPDKECIFAVDHISHINVDGMTEDIVKFAHIVRELKDLAVKLDVPIILLVQLSRANTNREDKRPTMADIRACGEIEQVADVIVMPHRENYYDNDTKGERYQVMEVIFDKYRNGRAGVYEMMFDTVTNVFMDIEKSVS